MPKILSVVADLNHIAHPLQKPNLSQPRKPTLVDRIFGVVCLILTVPLTLGILTGLYFYWAKRKISYIDKTRATQVDRVMKQVFGNVVAQTPESTLVSNAARMILSGKKQEADKHLDSLADEGHLTPQVKEALLEMVVTNNQVGMLEDLKNRFVDDTFPIEKFPLHKARSGKMVAELVRLGVPVDIPDENGRTPLHHASSVDVAKALVKNKSEFWKKEDKDGLTPLSTVTSPEVLKAIISESAEVWNIRASHRQEYTHDGYFQAFRASLLRSTVISEEEPEKKADIDSLRNNMKAILNGVGRENLETNSTWAKEAIDSRSPEQLKLLIEGGAAVNPLDLNLLVIALEHLNNLILNNYSPVSIANARETVNVLIDKGAQVNREDHGKGQSLRYCVKVGDPALLQKLIDRHVELTQADDHLDVMMDNLYLMLEKVSTPEIEKRIEDLSACVPILLEAGVKVTLGKEYALLRNCINFDVPHKVVNAFVTKGITLNEGGETPLLNVALEAYGNLHRNSTLSAEAKKKRVDNLKEIINILIKGGAKVSQDTIFTVVDTSDPDLVRLFLEIVPADGGGKYSNTPLQNALFNLSQAVRDRVSDQEIQESKEIVRLLVAKGASMEKDLLNHLKDMVGVDDIVQLLKDKGATR